MIELKVYEELEDYVGYDNDTPTEMYNKVEADKFIAGKDKEIAVLRNEADIYKAKYEQEYDIAVHNERQLSAMRIELRRHKYKRCLDNAWFCQKLSKECALVAYTHRGWTIESHFDNKAELYRKWRQRWVAIAEKFKEN